MIRNAVVIIIAIIMLLAAVFLKSYKGDLIPSWLFWVLIPGTFLLIVFLIALAKKKSHSDSGAEPSANQVINDLIWYGNKITVDLKTCEVKTSVWTNNEVAENDTALLMTLTMGSPVSLFQKAYQNANQAPQQIHQSVIMYECEINGKKRTFSSPVLPFDRANLIFKLYDKDSTLIYADKNNPDRFFFDLDFLFKE